VTGAWYRRLGLEARNVAITTVVALLALALFMGAVVLVTALATR